MPHHQQHSWSSKNIDKVKNILSCHVRINDAIPQISRELDFECTYGSVRHAFARAGQPSPSKFLKPVDKSVKHSGTDQLLQRLFDLTKRAPLKFDELCDKMDMSPAKTRALVDRAKSSGLNVRVEQGHVGIEAPPPDDRIKDIGIAPVVGKRQTVAVISDTHLGSKYCLRKQLREFIEYSYSKGVREILHPGDILDGDYRHGKFEMSHMGLDEQTEDLFQVLPQLKGLTYHAITGNHDNTFTEASGVNVGRYIANYFHKRNRSDFFAYGDRGAFLKIRGAVIHLWHPRSGVSYARSYALQKHIEKYSSGEKPHILLAGHWHVYCHVYERGVHAYACPTFQGGGSAFAKSLGGAPAMGGLILSWEMTRDGTMRSFVEESRMYFERETPVRVDDRDSGIVVTR